MDLLNVTVGVRGGCVKDASTPKGITVCATKLVREASGLPVVGGQRITTPELAERVLPEGADLIDLARAYIADPDWIHNANRAKRS